MTKVRVEGLRELEQALSELPKATGKALLRRVAIAALKPVEAAARANAPVFKGFLKASIVTGTKLTRRQARFAKKEGKSSVEVHTGTKDAAAIAQEFGTFKESAQPFLRPAWDAHKDDVLEAVKRDLGSEIDKAAARAAKRKMK